jgi:hypothetical protein
MEIKCEYYQVYLAERCMMIPTEHLQKIVDELAANAKFYMNSDVDSTMTEKVNAAIVDLLKNQKYKYLPLYLIAEAFTKGSLGELGGTTRFTVRNVVTWLNQMNDRMIQIERERKSKEDAERRALEEKAYKKNQSRDSLFGTAHFIKVAWHCTGAINDDDWDLYPLDPIVDLLEAGHEENAITPSMIRK